jgi:endogenous inhibitor of DNA gyrase (YacG/DUF329 family)
MESPKYIIYDGLRFCRDDKTSYYLNSTIRKRLHRYVWEKEVGPIPAGYHVHHINGNKADNRIDNLSIMTARGHERLHGQEIERKQKQRENQKIAVKYAPEWHRSEEGKKWHSEHAKGRKALRYTKTCPRCGKIFEGTKNQLYCSNACKAAIRRKAGLDDIPAVCAICGKPFYHNKYSQQVYCSKTCRDKAHIGWYERKMQR